MTEQDCVRTIAMDLNRLRIGAGSTILVHSSFKSLGPVPSGPETVIRALLSAIGPAGTLLMPALSYEQQPPHIHDSRSTPSNVGVLAEFFRTRKGTLRSIHPTHSICGVGKAAEELLKDHHRDSTPCGANSPLSKMMNHSAKIVMLGCGLKPNTTMHMLEEHVNPPYLFSGEMIYTITDLSGNTYQKKYRRHGFQGWEQRYDRIQRLPDVDFISRGRVLQAETFVLDAARMMTEVLNKMRENPLYFVSRASSE